jgi:small subunit ribosomal protein S2
MFKIEELFKLGFHYGHRKWRSSQKMKEYIFCEKWGISIIDLCKTAPLFEAALNAIYDCARKGGRILFIGTKPQARELVQQIASDCNQFYVDKRWIGGTLTNYFSAVYLPLDKLSKMETDEASGKIANFVKKERMEFSKKKKKLNDLFSGVRGLDVLPSMLIVIDPKKEWIAVKEAFLSNIPVIALADTDTPDPSLINHIVPGNDDSVSVISEFLNRCQDAIKQGMFDLNVEKTPKVEVDTANVAKVAAA